MEKIKLPKRAKEILWLLNEEKYKPKEEDMEVLNYLEVAGFGEVLTTADGLEDFELNEFASAYLYWNPKLKNPSIWDDKKDWITTGISGVALVFSIYASFIK